MNKKELEKIRKEVNFRSLGGIQMKDGRRIKDGLFYRSGALYQLNEEEKEIVRNLSLRKILDLRGKHVNAGKKDPDFGASYVKFDGKTSEGGESIDFSPSGFGQTGEAADEQFYKVLNYYIHMPFGYDALHRMFDNLQAGKTPFLIHCAKGKDRTGIAVMTLLIALGADEPTILQDYMRSNDYRREMIEARLAEGKKINPEDEGYLRLMFLREGVSEEIGRSVLEEIRTRCGGLDNYMAKEYHWTPEMTEQFRNRYLE